MPPLLALATTDNAMLLLVANYCRGGHKVPDTAMARSSVTARGQTAVLTIRHSGAASLSLASMLSASLASASISSLLFAKQLIYGVGWFHLRLGADATMCSSDFLPTLAPGPGSVAEH